LYWYWYWQYFLWGVLPILFKSIVNNPVEKLLSIRDNGTFFASSYGSDVISMSKSAFLKGVGHLKHKFLVEGDIAYQPLLVSKN